MARFSTKHAPTVRWHIEPPMPQETFESVCERAYHRYKGISLAREGWLVDFCRMPGREGMSRGARSTLRLARALGVHPSRMHATMLLDAPHRLTPAARRAYCRACWVEDDRHARPRYFRRDWAGALTVSCAVHHEPLSLAAAPQKTLEDVPIALDARTLATHERRVLAMIDRFAAQLEASVFHAAPWPDDWAMDALRSRNLVARCVSNLLLNPAPAPSRWAWLGEGGEPLCHDPRTFLAPTRASPWEAYRQIASPATRRAALWQVAWRVVPGREPELRPRGLGEHLVREDPATMARESNHSVGRRMRRLRDAFAREANGWRL